SVCRGLKRVMRRDIGTVIAGDTRCSRFLLRTAPMLPPGVQCFPMCELELFEQLYDKWGFATLLEELSLPGPRTTLLRCAGDLERCEIQPPVIIKPTQGEGGLGIEMASTFDELQRVVEARANLEENPIVVQSYIPGSDIDLSLLADRGRCVAWTIQQLGEKGVMRFLDRSDVFELGQELVRQTGYHGVMHLDMRIDRRNGRVLFIESNPRFWGSLCYSVWTGVNFLDLGLRLTEGEDVARQFSPVDAECPYLAITRRSLPRALVGGWPASRRLSEAQRRSWRFHHRFGGGSISDWLKQNVQTR
ncbi:MAG: ATP-grasp domain-containing protein, partial [Deltaproteobacteria bacterium]